MLTPTITTVLLLLLRSLQKHPDRSAKVRPGTDRTCGQTRLEGGLPIQLSLRAPYAPSSHPWGVTEMPKSAQDASEKGGLSPSKPLCAVFGSGRIILSHPAT